MHPHMRHRLTNIIQYHESMADHHGELHKKLAAEPTKEEDGTSRRLPRRGLQEEAQDGDDKAKSEAKPEQKSIDQQIAETHAEAANQLRDLLNDTPQAPVIRNEREKQTIVRDNRPMPAMRVN